MSIWDDCAELAVLRAEDRDTGNLNPGGYIPSFDRLLDQALNQHPELAHTE